VGFHCLGPFCDAILSEAWAADYTYMRDLRPSADQLRDRQRIDTIRSRSFRLYMKDTALLPSLTISARDPSDRQ
jgi:hypothetical protein